MAASWLLHKSHPMSHLRGASRHGAAEKPGEPASKTSATRLSGDVGTFIDRVRAA
jgi:hypothetical protein